MNTKLIQILDRDDQVLVLYSYNGDRMDNEEAGQAIDEAWRRDIENYKEANDGEEPEAHDIDATEYLESKGIERIYIEDHSSAHF